MVYYKLIFYDRRGRIVRIDEAEFASDDAALAAALAQTHSPVIEAWQEERRVGVIRGGKIASS